MSSNFLLPMTPLVAAAWAKYWQRPTIWDVIREMEKRQNEEFEKQGLGHA